MQFYFRRLFLSISILLFPTFGFTQSVLLKQHKSDNQFNTLHDIRFLNLHDWRNIINQSIDVNYSVSSRGTQGIIPIVDLQKCVISTGLKQMAIRGGNIKNQIGKIIDTKIRFENNKDNIHFEYIKVLNRLARALNENEYQQYQIIIGGHANQTGNRNYNQQLSCRRAARVMQVLRDNYDVNTNRLSAIGYGFDLPMKNTDPIDGINRRISIRLIK